MIPVTNENYYQMAWGVRTVLIENMINEIGNDLPAVLNSFLDFERRHALRADVIAKDDPRNDSGVDCFSGKVAFLPIEDQRNLEIQGDHAIHYELALRREIIPKLAEAVGPDTRTVIELGSGNGLNLFSLFYDLGKPRDIRFIAAEYTQSGQKLCARLGELEPAMNLECRAFDHSAPVFEPVDGDSETLVYSVHSIEQVKHLPGDFDALAAIAEPVTGMHFEPFQFQAAGKFDGKSDQRAFTEAMGYNLNLLGVFEAAVARGVVDKVDLDFLAANTGETIPSSLIHWRRP